MGMMARMRSLAPWFIIAVGGLFVLFMVLSDSKLADVVGKQSNNVGTVNGKDITYQEFSNLVEQLRKQQVAQTGNEIPESQMENFRNQVWERIISQKLIDEKINELGIKVTDEEIISTITGPNPPQMIKQYFIDSTGTFNRAAYDEAIRNPQNKTAMLQTEEMVRQQLIQQKLTEYLNASVVISDSEIEKQFVQQNIKMSADYAFVNVNSITDTTIKVSEDEIEKYYKKHSDDYKVDAKRKLKYVLFSNKATKDDTLGIEKNLSSIIEKIKDDTSSFKTYVEIYSDAPYSLDTVKMNLLGNAGNLIANSEKGKIVGPVLTSEGYAVYKLNDIIKSKDELVRASHILIRTNSNEEEAKKKIDEIYAELKNGADFEKLAKEKSEDGSAQKGGDLGWFGKGQMVKEFENASFKGKVGVIQKPIKTQFGYHIVKVTGKSNKEYAVEKIVNKITASATTMDRAYDKANDFAYIAGKNDFENEAKLLNYEIKETPAFTEKGNVIPGLGANNALLRFAFDNSVGDLSQVFKVPAGYVVAVITEKINVGTQPFDEVKERIKRIVLREKKMDRTYKIAEEIKAKVGGTDNFNAASTVYPNVRVSKAENFTTSGSIPGIGRDIVFAQAALDAEPNKIVGPIKSNQGSYLLKLTQRTPIDSTLFSIQKKSLRSNLMNQKRNRVFSDWITALKENADIEDNRHIFYR